MKPKYYDRFACLADRCSFTCCREWKIGVDDKTAKLWQRTESPDGGKLKKYITIRDGQRVVCLKTDADCPFLNEEGLCKIVIMHGDEMLSETCRQFPREMKVFQDRIERNMMSTCPEVLDFLKDEGFELVMDEADRIDDLQEDKLFKLRELLLAVMKMKDIGPKEALRMAFYIVNDCLMKEDAGKEWQVPQMADVEALKAAIKVLIADADEKCEAFIERNELTIDISENYRKQGLYLRFLDSVCQVALDYEARMDEDAEEYDEGVFDEVCDYIEEYEAAVTDAGYSTFFMNLIAEEIFADTLNAESDLETMLMRIEWIALEMAVIDQIMLLKYISDGRELALSYGYIRDIVVTVMRMTGYDEADIEEYMEDCFSSIRWDFAYLKLITE